MLWYNSYTESFKVFSISVYVQYINPHIFSTNSLYVAQWKFTNAPDTYCTLWRYDLYINWHNIAQTINENQAHLALNYSTIIYKLWPSESQNPLWASVSSLIPLCVRLYTSTGMRVANKNKVSSLGELLFIICCY